jgi:xanthine/uracil/vitamin C permease (AzgA family)
VIARWFAFAERGTSPSIEIRAGVTTFMYFALPLLERLAS